MFYMFKNSNVEKQSWHFCFKERNQIVFHMKSLTFSEKRGCVNVNCVQWVEPRSYCTLRSHCCHPQRLVGLKLWNITGSFICETYTVLTLYPACSQHSRYINFMKPYFVGNRGRLTYPVKNRAKTRTQNSCFNHTLSEAALSSDSMTAILASHFQGGVYACSHDKVLWVHSVRSVCKGFFGPFSPTCRFSVLSAESSPHPPAFFTRSQF